MNQIDQKTKGNFQKKKLIGNNLNSKNPKEKLNKTILLSKSKRQNLRQVQVAISKRKSYKDEILNYILEDKVNKIIQIL
ncbi:hypothetical protein TTHERM_00191020 (macronuclear) [Tetrahymena thermophila SB210]|uniref:Transmembrane protein n=1 Tax=Tetrahymena thermophila (strain SB210) TaxID=312017 RepID=I7M817_TETTS|nr:hypothetical protein TTHERM_00191020 [Tetrahymena thermophila SB210]EAR96434.1 hypothetical protein TTHERM_00191020 [Tetrahymena thermophila SB210]|eukprot:XP_001016679.1 hypothetical protein TTHERM_00191020 [Tetrahymena thermophila SB210]